MIIHMLYEHLNIYSYVCQRQNEKISGKLLPAASKAYTILLFSARYSTKRISVFRKVLSVSADRLSGPW